MSTTVNITETVNLVTLTVTEDGESTTINIKDNVGPQGPQGPAGAGFLGNGFIDYNNTDSPTSITADTWTTLPNDGLGAFSNSTYAPTGVSQFIDTSTGAIDVSDLELGDTVLIRNDFSVTPNTNNALLEFRYQLGTGAGAYTLETVMGRLDDGSGKAYRFALKPDLIYMGDANTRDNPISLQIRLSTNGTVSNAGSVIQLIRKQDD